MKGIKNSVAASALGAALLMAPGAASAETVTIGSSLEQTRNFTLAACAVSCTAVQRTQVAGPTKHSLTSPVNGAVTTWSLRSGLIGDVYRLRILRPGSGLSYTFAGSSTNSPPDPDVTDAIRNYTASVPIQQGDAIGLQNVSGTGVPLHTGAPLGLADTIAYSSASAADGSSALFSDTNGGTKEVLVRATISFCRVPNVAGLKRADAESALATAGCAAKATNKKLKRTKKNRKRRGNVLQQLTAAGETVAPGTAIELRIAALRKKKKK